jgi:hypothetical protein
MVEELSQIVVVKNGRVSRVEEVVLETASHCVIAMCLWKISPWERPWILTTLDICTNRHPTTPVLAILLVQVLPPFCPPYRIMLRFNPSREVVHFGRKRTIVVE